MKPIIALAGNLLLSPDTGFFKGDLYSYVNNDYVQAIIKAGGIPIVIPVQSCKDDIIEIIKKADKVILTGGYDVDPLLYGENPIPELGMTMRNVDEFYFKVIQACDQLNKPLLGICKGIQALNVAFKGTLYQDLHTQKQGSFKHRQDTYKYLGTHYVHIEKDNLLYDCFGETMLVNSYHHQAVKDIAPNFRVIALSDDGVIEAIERKSGTYMVGVQWHPEMMISGYNEDMLHFIKMFIQK